ncbi:MAG: 2,3-bisphosphoglycerate-independent phosphoglycerate mutase [Nitrospinaceae bacterium]|jgi:2,3-bisphosphoglycerate-independent phosphoglycerate mutase|nr:2,3-bisphosphoglycerate-independent phosphoglycerate mutase [Nitrospinaceae bacterium]|tara:strand:- start:3031 stop:4224 length:1194 start_codon:yes stop_codon:yes gene_type:complete
MKYLVVIVAGLTDRPFAERDNKTPLQLADTPNLDALTQNATCGPVQTIPDDLYPGNEISCLGLLGLDPKKYSSGHAQLSAIGLGVKPAPDEVALCCDLVTLQPTHDDMVMKDYTGEHLSHDDSGLLMDALKEQVVDTPVTFHNGGGYHNLMFIKMPPISERLSPPNELIGEGIRQFMPEGNAVRELVFVMNQAQIIFHNHAYNKKRVAEGKDPVNSIWLWGNGKLANLPSFRERYEKSASLISASLMVKGIGKLTGMNVVEVEGATGFSDTNYSAKVSATLKELENKDVVFLHISAGEEVSLKGDIDDKILMIEDFDAQVIGPLVQAMEAMGNIKLLVVVNHISSAQLMKYDRSVVPYLVYPAASGNTKQYDEQLLETGKLFPNAPDLLTAFLANQF